MRFTSQVRYAVLAVFDMAYHETGDPHQAKTISKREGIPPRYLEQIFQRLVRSGILRSKRGPKGGYSLARPTSRLTIGDIIRATEGSVEALFNGRENAFRRAPAGPSGSKARGGEEVWRAVVSRMSDVIETITIEELVGIAEKLGLEREVTGDMYFI